MLSLASYWEVHGRTIPSMSACHISASHLTPAGHLVPADDGPQTIPEQEVPATNGREELLERRAGELADPTATYRQLGTPRDTPEPPATHGQFRWIAAHWAPSRSVGL